MINNQEIFNQPILKVDTAGIKTAITIKDVKFDDEAIQVADPFLVYNKDKFFLFYELTGKNKKVIAVSESFNGKDYQWSGVVLDESNRDILLSFPYVFRDRNNWYMIPEQSEKGSSWSFNYLYKTEETSFPFGWKRDGILFDFGEKRKITDKAIIQHNGMYYVFYGLGDSRRHKLNVAMFEDLENRKPRKHPASPIIETPEKGLYSTFIFFLNIIAYKFRKRGLEINNSKLLSGLFLKLSSYLKLNPCRPGGKIIKTSAGEIIIYLQDQGKKIAHWDIRRLYGSNVSAMVINKLTPEEIKFRIHDSYVIKPTFKEGDWNKEKMHTVSPINIGGDIFVAMDGSNGYNNEWSIAVVKMDIFKRKKIIMPEDLKKIRKENQSIVFCSGCYDVLHSGHVVFFKQCKQFGDILVVSVGSDKVVKELKGPNRPINPERNRAYLLAALEDIDYVVIGGDEILPGKIDFRENIEKLRPDVFVVNDDDSAIEEKKALCEELGIKLELVSRIVPDFLGATSSTEIIKNFGKFI